MRKTASVSEAAAAYGTAVADLHHPIILEQEGRPLAVIIAFEEYEHLRELAADEEQRRQGGWLALEAMLKRSHQRPCGDSPEQVEAEIGAARDEVRKARYERRGH